VSAWGIRYPAGYGWVTIFAKGGSQAMPVASPLR
jgi:hypothetical protein